MAKAVHQNALDGEMKAGGANRIRYPGSPSRKRCELDDPVANRDRSVAGKPLSSPPGEYGRKTET